MEFLPSLHVLIAFTAASLVLIFTPGPDMTLFLGQTLTAGRARGFAALLGAVTGIAIQTALVGLGLSALLLASATAFTVVKIAGAAYLLWLAVQALRSGSALNLSGQNGRVLRLPQVYLMGLGINLLNPKVVIFVATFLPQFVSASDPQAGGKMLFLGLYLCALSIPTCAMLIVGAQRFTAALRRSPRIMRVVDYLFAGLMGAFAVRLLLARND
jgi:threonine/homoserine/homoserine lactone efflux protein